MKLYNITSWFPHNKSISGIFTKDQIYFLANKYSKHMFLLDSVDASVSLRNFCLLFQGLPISLNHRFVRDGAVLKTPKVVFFHPRVPLLRRILERYCFENFRTAMSSFGPIDLIHAHVSYPAGVVAMELSRAFNVPYVVTEHMGPFPLPIFRESRRMMGNILRCLESAAAVIAVSPFLAAEMRRYVKACITVIPNMVNEDRYRIQPLTTEKFSFFTLSSMTLGKGIDTLLHAISKWRPLPKDVEFMLGGGGPLLGSFQKLAERLGIQDVIRWLGPVPPSDVPECFAGCRVFISPSNYETFGMVCAEAIACGKPVIATRSGGSESIVNDINGILVDVNDPDQLYEAMRRMYLMSESFESRRIRDDFMLRFSRNVVAQRILGLYRKVTLCVE